MRILTVIFLIVITLATTTANAAQACCQVPTPIKNPIVSHHAHENIVKPSSIDAHSIAKPDQDEMLAHHTLADLHSQDQYLDSSSALSSHHQHEHSSSSACDCPECNLIPILNQPVAAVLALTSTHINANLLNPPKAPYYGIDQPPRSFS